MLQSGLDPQDSAQRGVDMVNEALRRGEEDALLHVLANNLHLGTATFRAEHALDPLPALAQAIDSANRGIQLYPGYWILHNDLFATYQQRADYLMSHGGDPDPSLRAAWHETELLAQLPAAGPFIATARANYYWSASEAARLRGEDSTPLLAKLLAVVQEQVRLQPHDTEALGILTSALLAKMPKLLAAGESATAVLEDLAELSERHMREFPQSPDGFIDRAQLASWRAQVLLQAGHSPLAELAQGRMALATARRIKPGRADLQTAQGWLCWWEAEWLRTQRLPELTALRCAAPKLTSCSFSPAPCGGRPC